MFINTIYKILAKPSQFILQVITVTVCIWIVSILASLPWLYIAVYRSSQLVNGTPIMVRKDESFI